MGLLFAQFDGVQSMFSHMNQTVFGAVSDFKKLYHSFPPDARDFLCGKVRGLTLSGDSATQE